jgi:hypothetical protein
VDCIQAGWTAERCQHDDSIVAGVPVEAVLAMPAPCCRRR